MATIQNITLTAAGGTFNVNHSPLTQIVSINTVSAIVLANDVTIQITGIPAAGESVVFMWLWSSGNIDLNGYNFTVNGQVYTQQQLDCPAFIYLTSINGLGTTYQYYVPDITYPSSVLGGAIVDESVTLAKLEDLTSAQIIVGNGSNRPAAVAVTGDIAITNAGVTSIAAGVIVNADVNASAAIARSKLASGTASHVVINDGSGNFSSEAQLAKSRGGFGQDVSAATGIVKFAGGTLSISSSVESRDYLVSFETGYVNAQNTYTLGYDCTLTPTNCSAFVIKAIAATDDAVITIKKNGVAIASATITFAASSAQDAAGVFGAFSATNFTAGDTISLEATKPTAGGVVNVTLQFTRNT